MRSNFLTSATAAVLVLTPALIFTPAMAQERGGAGGGAMKGGGGERSMEAPGGDRGSPAPQGGTKPKAENDRDNGQATKAPGAEQKTSAEKGSSEAAKPNVKDGRTDTRSQKTDAGSDEKSGREKPAGADGKNAKGDPAKAGGKDVRVSSEQRSKMRATIRDTHVESIHNVNFAINVGTVVPARYHFYPLPPAIIEYVPEYRGYDYILVDDQIIILEPGTHRIVLIID